MKDYWQSLSLREKKMLILGMASLVIFIIAFSWKMLLNSEQTLQSQVKHRSALLAWMQQADKKLNQTSAKTIENTNTQTLAATVQTAVSQSGIAAAVTQLQKTENDTIEITLKDATFDQLIKFLNKIWIEHHLTVAQTNITRGKISGVVNATITLQST